jgi:hypothetical protein
VKKISISSAGGLGGPVEEKRRGEKHIWRSGHAGLRVVCQPAFIYSDTPTGIALLANECI